MFSYFIRSDPWAGLIASRGSFYPMVLCQLLGIIIRICSKRFLPDKSSINVVERRSVPGGYFSELIIGRLLLFIIRGTLYRELPIVNKRLSSSYGSLSCLSVWRLLPILNSYFTIINYCWKLYYALLYLLYVMAGQCHSTFHSYGLSFRLLFFS